MVATDSNISKLLMMCPPSPEYYLSCGSATCTFCQHTAWECGGVLLIYWPCITSTVICHMKLLYLSFAINMLCIIVMVSLLCVAWYIKHASSFTMRLFCVAWHRVSSMIKTASSIYFVNTAIISTGICCLHQLLSVIGKSKKWNCNCLAIRLYSVKLMELSGKNCLLLTEQS